MTPWATVGAKNRKFMLDDQLFGVFLLDIVKRESSISWNHIVVRRSIHPELKLIFRTIINVTMIDAVSQVPNL